MKKILITMQIPKTALDKLKNFELDYNDSLVPMSYDILKEKIKNVDAILCPLSQKIDKNLINHANNLKIIANFGAGYDNIDIEEASKKNISVTNTPAINSSTSTAELTMGLIIDVMRGITMGDKNVRVGNFEGWKPTYNLGCSLSGKKIGIFGLGNIGKKLAKLSLAFGMEVVYFSRTRKIEIENELNIKYMEIDEMLKEIDVLSINSSYNKNLYHFFNINKFKLMKKTAFLVNSSRGAIINDEDLAKALNENIIAGAAIDVYENEPNVSKCLIDAKNIILSPHLGNATNEAREEMGEIAVDNIISVLSGYEAKNKIN